MSKHPTIALARDLAKRRGLDGVLIVAFVEGSYSVTSYGSTTAQCKALKGLNEYVADALGDGRVDLGAFAGCPWPQILQD